MNTDYPGLAMSRRVQRTLCHLLSTRPGSQSPKEWQPVGCFAGAHVSLTLLGDPSPPCPPRSVGDGEAEAVGVISTPDVSRVALSPDDLCVIVASDGLWEVFTSQEAAMW